MSKKILLIDDDKKLVNLISKYLLAEGYQTETASDGPSGLSTSIEYHPDVIILDIMLPGFDGLELLRQLRKTSDAYVIMLTAKAEEIDKVIGLTLGADDYMVKPFSPRELVARVKAAIRRMESNEKLNPKIRLFNIELNPHSREVYLKDKKLDLTKTEFDLMEVLMRNQGIAMSREKLLNQVWGYGYIGESRAVDVAISELRKKLGKTNFIDTIRGIGYKFKKEEK